jgi:hypothetical protein
MAIDSSLITRKKVRSNYNQNLINRGITIPAGIYLGEVTQNDDPNNYGRIKVHIFRFFTAITPDKESDEANLGSLWCQRIIPFGGTTNQGGATSSSYGILGPAPDVGNKVIVAYTGDYTAGIVLGVLPDLIRQTSNTTGGSVAQTSEGVKAAFEPQVDGSQEPRPTTPSTALDFLQDDTIRGPQRPNPRNMGMSDRRGNALTLSPGDEEDNTGSGVRLKTSQGSQIVMDDRTGTIYINNRSGTSWIEMNNNGDIDIFCQGTFSVNAVGGFNFHTANNFAVQADEAINMKSLGGGGIKIQSAEGNIDMNSLLEFRITAQGGQLHVNTGGNILLSSRAQIHLNGPTADRAQTPAIANQLGNKGVTQSISGRVPESEPWRGHLDYSPDADRSGNPNEYSTAPGAGVNPQRAGNQFQPIPEDASDLVFWDNNVDRRIDRKIFDAVESIAREYGKPFRITKAYIEPSRSGGTSEADNSLHMTGRAVDIVHASGNPNMSKTQIFQLIDLAKSNGIGGIGIYSDNRPDAPLANKMHLDLGRERIWGRCSDGTLSYDCLPQIIKDRAEELGYNPDIPAQDSSIANSDRTPSRQLTNAQVDEILGGEAPSKARASAEEYLGRPMSDAEWDNLVAATVAESLPNSPKEQAYVMAVILNRTRNPGYPDNVIDVLNQPLQFQAVTGTPQNPTPSPSFTNPSRSQIASTIDGVTTYLDSAPQNWNNFTANNPAAYGPGTNIGFLYNMRRNGGNQVVGGTIFGNAS